MFKTVSVFVVLFAAVYAKPGYLEAYPAATSHVSRVDIVHPQPIVKSYAVPYYGHGYGYGNGGYGYGGYGNAGYGYGGYGHGYAHSYSDRIDYPTAPVAVNYGHLGYYGGYGHGGWDY